MPRLNRTGPLGYGARTGRGLGFCTGYPPTTYSPYQYSQPTAPIQQPYNGSYPYARGWGGGLGMGYGRGLGSGRGLGLGIGRNTRRRFW